MRNIEAHNGGSIKAIAHKKEKKCKAILNRISRANIKRGHNYTQNHANMTKATLIWLLY